MNEKLKDIREKLIGVVAGGDETARRAERVIAEHPNTQLASNALSAQVLGETSAALAEVIIAIVDAVSDELDSINSKILNLSQKPANGETE
jgi:hypothetical protein